MKLRTLTELQTALDVESSWRKKELLDTRLHVIGTSEPAQRALRRAAFALTYAHWEGFTKVAFEHYLAYVRTKQLKLVRLHPAFAALSISKTMRQMSGVQEARLPAAILQLRDPGASGTLPAADAVTAKSNLNSENLIALLSTFGLESTDYATRFNWLDATLLAGRNGIAHGRESAPSLDEYVEAVTEVLILIEMIKNQILNAAVDKQFEAPSLL